MKHSDLKEYVEALTDKNLEALSTFIEKETRKRRIKFLLALDCDCDRYTCGRCRALDEVSYDPKTDKDL